MQIYELGKVNNKLVHAEGQYCKDGCCIKDLQTFLKAYYSLRCRFAVQCQSATHKMHLSETPCCLKSEYGVWPPCWLTRSRLVSHAGLNLRIFWSSGDEVCKCDNISIGFQLKMLRLYNAAEIQSAALSTVHQ